MLSRPLEISMPDCEIARDAALMFPARVRLKVTANAECLGVAGLYGVTQYVKGFRAARAVCRDDGNASGRADMKGERREGVE